MACFAVLALRLLDLSLLGGDVSPLATRLEAATPKGRAEIVDRNGALLATNLQTASVYADPSRILDARDTALRLVSVLPDLSVEMVRQKLISDGRFQWIKRGLSPQEEAKVLALGLPGIGFRYEDQRFYPHGALASHVLGFVNVDDEGLEGIERSMNGELKARGSKGAPLSLSLDIRVQHAVRAELQHSMKTFSAKGAAGVVMDVNTGEVVALVSLPDFDPNRPGEANPEFKRNNAVSSRYEMGSTFKAFTTAMVLDKGVARLTTSYDATKPIRIGRHSIRDHHAENRWLTVPEVVMHSSNIGASKMALSVSPDTHWQFLKSLGLMDAPGVELYEAARPLTPEAWRDVNRMTVSFGHGIAVTPLHIATALSATVNGGLFRPATLLPVLGDKEGAGARRVMSEDTSMLMRGLLRLVVETGTGKQAEALAAAHRQ
ncbi:MAG: peptidoglycan D,D-transpeptidase FtsI family protein [Alphaproteobacteria bacterium]